MESSTVKSDVDDRQEGAGVDHVTRSSPPAILSMRSKLTGQKRTGWI